MKPCINYSPAAVGLWQEGKIEVERFKVSAFHDWTESALSVAPAYLHFPLDTGPAGVTGGTVQAIRADLARTGTQFVNVHLVADPATSMTDQEVDAMFDKCLTGLVSPFGPEKVIAENVVSRADGSLSQRRSVEPEAMSRAIERAACGLLLDTAHLRITCIEHGWNLEGTLLALPLGRLAEWHVCGCQIAPGESKLRDSMPMTDEDWRLTETVARLVETGKAAKPKVVTLEYGGIGPKFDWRTDPAVITADLNRLHALIADW